MIIQKYRASAKKEAGALLLVEIDRRVFGFLRWLRFRSVAYYKNVLRHIAGEPFVIPLHIVIIGYSSLVRK